jgi:large subunit ribosomal protein L13
MFACILSVDCGDYVVVYNAKKVKVSGLKEKQLLYRKHSMYPGGLKETPYERMMQTKPWEVRPRSSTSLSLFTNLYSR